MTRKNINLVDNYVDKGNEQLLHITIDELIEFAEQRNLFAIDQSNDKYEIKKTQNQSILFITILYFCSL